MNLEGVKYKLQEGLIALRFVDDVDNDDVLTTSQAYPAMAPSDPVPYEGCVAVVSAVGAKVTGVKVGSTVVTRPWTRDGLKIGDDVVAYPDDIIATLLG